MVIVMKNFKEICKKLLILPIWLMSILTVFSTASLIFVFVKEKSMELYAYAIYVISFYTLTVIGIACFKTFPGFYGNIKQRVMNNSYANRYLTDVVYKTHITLYISLVINILYVAENAVSAVVYRTHWFAIFAVYYGIMALMRLLLVSFAGKNNIGESYLAQLKRSRICAYILLTVNVTLSGVVIMMIYYDRGFNYTGYLIYVMAMYTFYTTVSAVVSVVKYRKYNSPVMSMTKIIKLASSLFSMLFLETAMFSQFGEDTPLRVKQIMIIATGAGICVFVVITSIYMIVRATKEITAAKINDNLENVKKHESKKE